MLGNAGKLTHALLPVFELLAGASLLVFLLFLLSFVEGLLNLFAPLTKDNREIGNHSRVKVLNVVDVLGILLPLGWVGLKHNVALEGAEGLLNFLSELVESVEELALVVDFNHTPVCRLEFVDEGLVDVVHHGVQGDNGVLADFTEEDFVVILACGVHTLASGSTAHEVHALSAQLFLLAICDVELGLVGTLDILNFASLINGVRHLVIDEEMCGSSSL